jgi:hypothetical protein
MAAWSSKNLGVKLGSQSLRVSFVTWLSEQYQGDAAVLESAAYAMKHSPQEQQQTYNRSHPDAKKKKIMDVMKTINQKPAIKVLPLNCCHQLLLQVEKPSSSEDQPNKKNKVCTALYFLL